MKKILLLFVVFVCGLQALAQEADSTIVNSQTVSVDSLSIKFNKLQHDYDFLVCEFELHKMLMDLKDLSNSISISTNSLVIYLFNSRFERSLYNSFLEKYDSDYALLDSYKTKLETTRLFVLFKISQSDFTEAELNVLNSYFDTFTSNVNNIVNGLNYFEAALKTYKEKR